MKIQDKANLIVQRFQFSLNHLHPVILVFSFLLVSLFICLDLYFGHHIPEAIARFALMVGGALNMFAAHRNGGKMPALNCYGQSPTHCPITADTRHRWLCDIIERTDACVSIGDVVMDIAMAVIVLLLVGRGIILLLK